MKWNYKDANSNNTLLGLPFRLNCICWVNATSILILEYKFHRIIRFVFRHLSIFAIKRRWYILWWANICFQWNCFEVTYKFHRFKVNNLRSLTFSKNWTFFILYLVTLCSQFLHVKWLLVIVYYTFYYWSVESIYEKGVQIFDVMNYYTKVLSTNIWCMTNIQIRTRNHLQPHKFTVGLLLSHSFDQCGDILSNGERNDEKKIVWEGCKALKIQFKQKITRKEEASFVRRLFLYAFELSFHDANGSLWWCNHRQLH